MGWKIIIIFAGEKNGGQIWLLATTQKNAKTAFSQPYFPPVLIVFKIARLCHSAANDVSCDGW